MPGKGRDGRGKGNSTQATSKAIKTSKSAKKRKQQAKTPSKPNKNLIAAAETVLKNDTYKTQVEVHGFTWTDTLLEDIKTEYESMPHGKNITAADNELLRKESWQRARMSKARSDLGTGLVMKNGFGGNVGDVSSRWKSGNASTLQARQNTTDEKGPLQTFDLPVADLESIIELGEDLSRGATTEVPQNLIEFFPIGNDEAATAGAIEDFEGVMNITKAVFLIEEMNLTGTELDGMDHPEIDERVDVFMAENFSHLDKDSKEYEEEAGVRKFTLHFVKCRMTSVKEALKKGDAFLIPVKIKVDDKIIRFKAVFTVGGKKDEIERRAIELLRTICPGMSHKWHGSQANKIYMSDEEVGNTVKYSKFSISLRKVDPSVVAEMKSKRQKLTHEVSSSTSLVAASNTTVVSSPFPIEEQTRLPPKKQFIQRMQVSEVSSARIEKNILFEGTVVHVDKSSVNASSCSLTVDWDNGTTSCVEYPDEDIRIIGQLDYNRTRKQPSPGSTPPPEPDTDIDSDDDGNDQEVDGTGSGKKDKESSDMKFSHHRINNIMALRAGFDSNDPELAEYLEKQGKSCLEAMYLRTGESQVDESMCLVRTGDSQVVDELLRRSRLDIALEDMEEVVSREKVPQGQSDVDHCLHRYHWISNSIYLCFPMSHTANTCNSIIRRRAGDWLYCLTIHEYTNGA